MLLSYLYALLDKYYVILHACSQLHAHYSHYVYIIAIVYRPKCKSLILCELHATGHSNYLLPYLTVSGETTRQFFKFFGERFVKEVRSKDNPAFTAKLCRQNVIPERIENKIAKADDQESANSLLCEFLSQQLTPECLHTLLTVMTEAKHHPAMSKLGRDMKTALEMTIPTAAAGTAPGGRCTRTM